MGRLDRERLFRTAELMRRDDETRLAKQLQDEAPSLTWGDALRRACDHLGYQTVILKDLTNGGPLSYI